MRKSILMLCVTLAMAFIGSSPVAAQDANLSDQRCTEILNSLRSYQGNGSGGINIDEDFATAIAQREGVSALAVQDCAARYNAGQLPGVNLEPPYNPIRDGEIAGLTDQRCTEIIGSVLEIPGNAYSEGARLPTNGNFATPIAGREGVSVPVVQDCAARYNAGELSISSEGVSGQEQAQGELIYGTDNSDYLTGTRGSDRILGFGSDDVISEGYGGDLLRGGDGWDYIVGGYGDDALYGDAGGDWLDGGAGNDLVRGGSGDDLVDGGTGNDLVTGGDGNDAVYGYLGSDVLYGDAGNDLIYSAGDGAYDEVHGGSGYDVCIVGTEDFVQGCEEVYYGG